MCTVLESNFDEKTLFILNTGENISTFYDAKYMVKLIKNPFEEKK